MMTAPSSWATPSVRNMDMRGPALAKPEELIRLRVTLVLAGDGDVSFPGEKLLARAQRSSSLADQELIKDCRHRPLHDGCLSGNGWRSVSATSRRKRHAAGAVIRPPSRACPGIRTSACRHLQGCVAFAAFTSSVLASGGSPLLARSASVTDGSTAVQSPLPVHARAASRSAGACLCIIRTRSSAVAAITRARPSFGSSSTLLEQQPMGALKSAPSPWWKMAPAWKWSWRS